MHFIIAIIFIFQLAAYLNNSLEIISRFYFKFYRIWTFANFLIPILFPTCLKELLILKYFMRF